MGYNTTYFISVEDGDPTQADYENITEMLRKYEFFDNWGDEWFATTKWYEYQDNMCDLSKAFPQFRFFVHGDGDDSDDLWEDHWQNGLYQHCYAEIPPYDPSMMSPYVKPESESDEGPQMSETDDPPPGEEVELSAAQVERIDEIHNAVYDCILTVLQKTGEEFPWDMYYIGECADVLIDLLLKMGAADRISYLARVTDEATGTTYIEEYERMEQ